MPQNVEKSSWVARHWPWLIPIGCLGAIAGLVVFVAGILFVVGGAMRSSDAYGIPVTRAREHPEIVQALGEPIEVGWLVSGNVSVNGPSGEANLEIPLSGPHGSARLFVVAEKVAGEWIFERMEVAIEGAAERLDLLADASEQARSRIFWRLSAPLGPASTNEMVCVREAPHLRLVRKLAEC